MNAKLQSPLHAAAAFRPAAVLFVVAGMMLAAGTPLAWAKTSPNLHWPTPPVIRYGTGLNGNILNAWVSGSLPGTFVYSPAAGTVLSAGMHTLSVTFNPADATDYNSVSTTVQLTVIKAVLVVTAFNYKSLSYGDAIPTFQYSIKNFVNGDTLSGAVSGTPSLTTTAVRNSPVGQYPITAAMGTLSSANYSFTFVPATLTVVPTTLLVHAYPYTVPYYSPFPALKYSIEGFKNSDTTSVVSGSASVTTTAVFNSPVGAYPITATPGTLSAANYTFQFFASTLTITQATPKITWPTPAAIAYGTALSSNQLNASANFTGTFVYSPAAGAFPPVGTDTLSVTYTPPSQYAADIASATATAHLVVAKGTATPIVTTSAGVGTAGEPVTFTARILGGGLAPSGTVTFLDGSGTLNVATLTGGVANYTTSALGAGMHSIRVSYSGDIYYLSATSPALAQKIAPESTTTLSVTSGGSAVTTVGSGSVVTLTATVDSGGSALKVGQVNFCDDAFTDCTDVHLLGMAQLTSAGDAVLKFRPGVGSHSYHAYFLGTSQGAPAKSSSSALTVTGLPPSISTIAASGSSGNYSFTATVGGSGSAAPTGTVSFLDASNGNASLASAALVAGPAAFGFLAANLPLPDNPVQISVADLNGDGIPDVVASYPGYYSAATGWVAGGVAVLLGNGDGTFTTKTTLFAEVGYGYTYFIVGDFNGDGTPDLAVLAYLGASSSSLTTYFGNGDGTFTAGPATTGLDCEPLGVGDFNRDGIEDITSTCGLLLGKGDGTFTVTPMPANTLVMGDFNRDGNLDFVTFVIVSTNKASIIMQLGNGDGTFTAMPLDIDPGTDFNAGVAADFNGDGKLDWALINYNGGTITTCFGNGDGTLTTGPVLSLSFVNDLFIGDFNGDGIPDIAALRLTANSGVLSIELGRGDGSFTDTYKIPPYITAVAAGDLNGDGRTDLALGTWKSVGGMHTDFAVTVELAEDYTSTAIATGVSATATHNIVASYPGDSKYKPSVSQPTVP